MKLISHKIFLKHRMEGQHPERPERIAQALKVFEYEKAKNGEEYLKKVHTQRYIDAVKCASKEAGKEVKFLDSGETYACSDTYEAACYAVGATVQAAEYARKKQPAFAMVRPPGHHAHPDWTNGFCVFSNIAIGAAYLAEKGQKVLIVDIDMHRGDGTSDCVNMLNKVLDNRLFYFSINQEGVFPGATIDEGNIHNIYVPPNINEEQYISIMKKELQALISRFKPTIIAISAGFDSFATDKESYGKDVGAALPLTKKTIIELKKAIEGIPYFAVLEGGYNPSSVVQGVAAFIGINVKEEKKEEKPKEDKKELKKKIELSKPIKTKIKVKKQKNVKKTKKIIRTLNKKKAIAKKKKKR